MTTGEWTSERGRTLLKIARASLAEALGFGKALDEYGDPWLREPGATFVTLRRRGELRGCVGSILAYRPLFEDVWRNARAAAFHDTRFPPVAPEELAEIRVELSLLSPPEPLPCAGETEALRLLRPGVDGVILSAGSIAAPSCPRSGSSSPIPGTSWTVSGTRPGSGPATGRRRSGSAAIRS